MEGLRCTMPGCKTVIRAWTGLQEIQKLMKHFEGKHKLVLTMDRALEFRVAMEAGEAPIRIDGKKL